MTMTSAQPLLSPSSDSATPNSFEVVLVRWYSGDPRPTSIISSCWDAAVKLRLSTSNDNRRGGMKSGRPVRGRRRLIPFLDHVEEIRLIPGRTRSENSRERGRVAMAFSGDT
uniref:Uncharacterized protein n=1 Tax=Spongospora subterranea TaxID=70186 RepID=A0A0H5RFL3_9EUKA|eukprot:CRZ07444.1 hypothetical protein [Spongospora subterranea]